MSAQWVVNERELNPPKLHCEHAEEIGKCKQVFGIAADGTAVCLATHGFEASNSASLEYFSGGSLLPSDEVAECRRVLARKGNLETDRLARLALKESWSWSWYPCWNGRHEDGDARQAAA
eukprot:2876977-Amphidinium_carterae.1